MACSGPASSLRKSTTALKLSSGWLASRELKVSENKVVGRIKQSGCPKRSVVGCSFHELSDLVACPIDQPLGRRRCHVEAAFSLSLDRVGSELVKRSRN